MHESPPRYLVAKDGLDPAQRMQELCVSGLGRGEGGLGTLVLSRLLDRSDRHSTLQIKDVFMAGYLNLASRAARGGHMLWPVRPKMHVARLSLNNMSIYDIGFQQLFPCIHSICMHIHMDAD